MNADTQSNGLLTTQTHNDDGLTARLRWQGYHPHGHRLAIPILHEHQHERTQII